MILALDTSTVTGWAAGRPGETPTWGERSFAGRGGNGEVIGKFRHWVNQCCYELKPTLVVFEAPYIPRPGRGPKFGGPPPMNALTLRRLLALVGEVEAVCWELRIRCVEATAPEISKFFLGNARQGGRDAKKAATIKMCGLYGWHTVSDNAADALALWHYAEFITEPQIASRRLAGARRELPLHGKTTTSQMTEAQRGQTSELPGNAAPSDGERQCQTELII